MRATKKTAADPQGGRCRCGRKKQELWHLLCARCWDKVPTALQRRLFALYQRAPGSAEHTACVRQIFELLGNPRHAGRPMPPGMTSTTTPAGAAMFDPLAEW